MASGRSPFEASKRDRGRHGAGEAVDVATHDEHRADLRGGAAETGKQGRYEARHSINSVRECVPMTVVGLLRVGGSAHDRHPPALRRGRSAYRTLNLPQKGRQVLGSELNCSESEGCA